MAVPTANIVMVARGTEAEARAFGADAVLGRTIRTADGATFEIDDDRMSRAHVRVQYDRGHWVICDLDSRNGTHVNAHRIGAEVRRRGDIVLRIGHSVFVLLADATGHPAPITDGIAIGPELARAYGQLRQPSGSTLLVLAEPGAGKETAARWVHEHGPRRAGPFVAVSCPSMPEGVAPRLVFGGKRGGSIDRIGHVQMAMGGTLFLDEISVIGPVVQERLLDLIEAQADLNIVAGAHTELRLAVADGRFDAMLYKALAKATVQLPPLRERKVDIARILVRELAAVDAALRAVPKLVEACLVRPWPGNVRELKLAARKAAASAIAAGRTLVRLEDLEPTAGLSPGSLAAETAVERVRETPPLDTIDKAAIEAALVRANGVIHLAARVLGIHRGQLYQLMDQHEIVFTDDDHQA